VNPEFAARAEGASRLRFLLSRRARARRSTGLRRQAVGQYKGERITIAE
jgi:hypothetical protein